MNITLAVTGVLYDTCHMENVINQVNQNLSDELASVQAERLTYLSMLATGQLDDVTLHRMVATGELPDRGGYTPQRRAVPAKEGLSIFRGLDKK